MTLRWRIGTLLSTSRAQSRQRWAAILLWVTFCAGLAAQALAPGLKIQNHAYVIPQSNFSDGKEIRPTEIVARERQMQWLSVILTVGGALGLAFRYRRALVPLRATRPNL